MPPQIRPVGETFNKKYRGYASSKGKRGSNLNKKTKR